MADEAFDLQARGDGTYAVLAPSLDGQTAFTLVLGTDGPEGTGTDGTGTGLPPDEPTARATVRYLLDHQDASELPPWIELADIAAAYPDALDSIAELRGER